MRKLHSGTYLRRGVGTTALDRERHQRRIFGMNRIARAALVSWTAVSCRDVPTQFSEQVPFISLTLIAGQSRQVAFVGLSVSPDRVGLDEIEGLAASRVDLEIIAPDGAVYALASQGAAGVFETTLAAP